MVLASPLEAACVKTSGLAQLVIKVFISLFLLFCSFFLTFFIFWVTNFSKRKENEPSVANVQSFTRGVIVSTLSRQGISFGIFLTFLREIDSSGNTVYPISMDGLDLTLQEVRGEMEVEILKFLSDHRSKHTIYSQHYSAEHSQSFHSPSLPSFLQVIKFGQDTPINFANQTTTYTTNSIKLSVQVQNWPFRALSNSLVLEFTTETNGGTNGNEINPKCIQVDSSTDSNSNLNWLLINVDGVIMYLTKNSME
jgi:hypothetical protein